MLFMHEVHQVRGRAEETFEAAFRDGWMPMLAAGDDARLLWYANHAHGSGPAYTVVTVTAVRDGAAWERLALRVQKGDLREWMRDLDELRHDVDAKLLVPLPWSPLQQLDFDDVPVDGREHELTLYMEDTMWPYEDKFLEYIDRCGEVYAKSIDRLEPAADDRGCIPARARQPPAPRGEPDAAHPRPGGAAQTASVRDSARVPRPGDLDARRPGAARPVDQPAAADLLVVTPVLMDSMNIGTIIDAAAAGDPDRAALIVDGRTISYRRAGHRRRSVCRRPGRQRCRRTAGRRRRRRRPAVDRDDAGCGTDRRCGGADEPGLDSAGATGSSSATSGCADVGVAGEPYVDRLRKAGVSPSTFNRRVARRPV